jgi:hypothetical protein
VDTTARFCSYLCSYLERSHPRACGVAAGRTVLADPQPVRPADPLDAPVNVNHDEVAAALEIRAPRTQPKAKRQRERRR